MEGNSFIFISGSFFSRGGKVVPSAGNKVSEHQNCLHTVAGNRSDESGRVEEVTLNVFVNHSCRFVCKMHHDLRNDPVWVYLPSLWELCSEAPLLLVR